MSPECVQVTWQYASLHFKFSLLGVSGILLITEIFRGFLGFFTPFFLREIGLIDLWVLVDAPVSASPDCIVGVAAGETESSIEAISSILKDIMPLMLMLLLWGRLGIFFSFVISLDLSNGLVAK